jgi:hypothetical protein
LWIFAGFFSLLLEKITSSVDQLVLDFGLAELQLMFEEIGFVISSCLRPGISVTDIVAQDHILLFQNLIFQSLYQFLCVLYQVKEKYR